jgi:hypothetical protein
MTCAALWPERSGEDDGLMSDSFVWREITFGYGSRTIAGQYACSSGLVHVKTDDGTKAAPSDGSPVVVLAKRLMIDLATEEFVKGLRHDQ